VTAALVTGGAGFIGRWLTRRLVERCDQVVVLDDLSTGSAERLVELAGGHGLEFVPGSVLDAELVDSLVRRVDTVFHLAAAVGVKLIVDAPLDSLRTNIRGTENVLDSAHRHGARVLLASTSEIYGKNAADGIGEDADRILGSPQTSRWSYSEAKAVDESMTDAYVRAGLWAVVARLFNTVGPGQTGRYGMVIPRFVERALRDEPLLVHGDGSQTRCFCYVGDAVPALVDLVDCPAARGLAVNIGRPEEVTILELAQRVITLTGSRSEIHFVPYQRVYGDGFEDVPRRVPDISRARELIGFRPRVDLDGILREVIAEQSARRPELAEGRRAG
jgi:UDP-glucose 4-epimerase